MLTHSVAHFASEFQWPGSNSPRFPSLTHCQLLLNAVKYLLILQRINFKRFKEGWVWLLGVKEVSEKSRGFA
jgi:hypothetical protein